jgi:hypothetical protein
MSVLCISGITTMARTAVVTIAKSSGLVAYGTAPLMVMRLVLEPTIKLDHYLFRLDSRGAQD